MLLAFDIGNTETTVGLFRGAKLHAQWRLTTDAPHTPDELRFTLGQLVASAKIQLTDISGVVIASVVPPATPQVVEACRRSFEVEPIVVTPRSKLPITVQIDEPMSVGADRLINTLAASQLYKRDAIVVDLGTATTYDCITADGAFLGGIIQPGVLTSSESLVRRTSMLPATGLIPPKQALGKNTVDCIKAGVLFGTADSIDGLIRRLKREWPTKHIPYVIATGGIASTFHPLCEQIDEVDSALTLKGLQIAYSLLVEQKV